MKILYVAKKYNYPDKPEAGFSPAHYHLYEGLRNFQAGANSIIYLALDKLLEKEGKEKINKHLLETVDKEKPDLVFFVISLVDSTTLKKEFIQEITKKTTTSNWMTDDHWQFDKFSKHWAKYFTWMVTTDSKAPAKYHRTGYKNVIKSQWACNSFLYKPLNLSRTHEVTFVGRPHGERRDLVREIEDAGVNIKYQGHGWPEGPISEEEKIKIYSQSKINLNFTKSSGVLWKEIPLIFLYRDYDRSLKLSHPKEWMSKTVSLPPSIWSRQIKGRNFEVPACRSFLLTEYADNLKDYYEIGKEIVCFDGVKDLVKKTKYYLEHDNEREAIAKAGYERTLRDHTYENRFNEIFKIMGLIK